MGMEKIEKLMKRYMEKSNEKDKLILASEFFGLSAGEMSCFRGMLAEFAEDKAEYGEIMDNMLEKRSENTIRNDRKRYYLYSCVSEAGKELVLELSIERIKVILGLEKKDPVQYREVLELLGKEGMTKEILYDYLDKNVKKEESVYIKVNENLKPLTDFIKKAKRIEAGKFSVSMNAMIKSVGTQLSDILRIWEKVPDVQEFRKILGDKPNYLDVSTGVYF